MADTSHPLSTDVEAYLNRIDESNDDLPGDWAGWFSVAEAYRRTFQRLAAKDWGKIPDTMSGKGIVTCAGGNKFFSCAWVQISILRYFGCDLPVEVWYNGRAEMDKNMAILLESLKNVRVVNAQDIVKTLPKPPRRLNGWELKPFSILHSSFREVLFMDADCLPAMNPSYLFNDTTYRNTGAIFWPDLPPSDRKEWLPPVVWENCGLAYRDEVDFETGQMLINKDVCWKAINLTMWCNEHSDYFYKFVYGDKSTFHLAWRGCGLNYGLPRACGWKHPAIIQHDMQGKILFLHCCRGKEMIATGQKMTKLPSYNLPIDAWNVLTKLWTGQIYDFYDQTGEEKRMAKTLAGSYDYKRSVDPGGREIHLLGNGTIGLGSAACEKRWSVRIFDGTPTIVITGEAHKGTEIGMMFLTQDEDGVWRGKWEAHEKCDVELRLRANTEIPQWFSTRQDKWDANIFNSVVQHNEYTLPNSFSPDDVIIDIGAHIGSFAYACLIRNARRVIAFEPEATNYLMMTRSLKHFGDRLDVYRAAVGKQRGKCVMDFPTAPPPNCSISFDDYKNNTGGFVARLKELGNIDVITLDDIVKDLGEKTIRLVKIDTEGAEWEILENFTMIDRVQEIVGEYHEFTDPAALESKKERLANILDEKGYQIVYKPDSSSPQTMGLFRITRKRCLSDLSN